MQHITMFSVPHCGGTLYAIVPDASYRALDRLQRDDPIWERLDVYQHWAHKIFPTVSGVKVRDKIVFRYI